MKTTEKLNKADLQFVISSRAKSDTRYTDNWLKNIGMSERDLLSSTTLLLQAQKMANELLALHTVLIQQHKLQWLRDLVRRSRNNRQRQRITEKECYAVLNYAKSINRKLFKQQRDTQ